MAEPLSNVGPGEPDEALLYGMLLIALKEFQKETGRPMLWSTMLTSMSAVIAAFAAQSGGFPTPLDQKKMADEVKTLVVRWAKEFDREVKAGRDVLKMTIEDARNPN